MLRSRLTWGHGSLILAEHFNADGTIDSTKVNDTIAIDERISDPAFRDTRDPYHLTTGGELGRVHKGMGFWRLRGRILVPNATQQARLADRERQLRAAFDPALCLADSPTTDGAYPLDWDELTADTATYPTGRLPQRIYARPASQPQLVERLVDGTVRQFAVALVAPDPRIYEQSLGSLSVGPGYDAVILATAGLVAYWRLGELSGTVAADSKGTNHGTYVAAPTLGVEGALPDDSNTAVTFNGTSQYVTVPDAAALDLGDTLSIEAIVFPGAAGVNRAIMTKGPNGYEFVLEPTNKLRFTKAEVADIVTSTIAVPAGWHHVVITKSGATVKLYIDGADVTGTVTNATLADTALPLFIAARTVGGAPGGFANGSRDEVALYNVALSPATVAGHAAAFALAAASVVNKGTVAGPLRVTITMSGPGSSAFTITRGGVAFVLDLSGLVNNDVVVVVMETCGPFGVGRTVVKNGVAAFSRKTSGPATWLTAPPGTTPFLVSNTVGITSVLFEWGHARA